jgi:hypothetical protein
VQERGERLDQPGTPAPAPPPPEHVDYYTAADALLADLDAWGAAKAKQFTSSWGPTPPDTGGQQR